MENSKSKSEKEKSNKKDASGFSPASGNTDGNKNQGNDKPTSVEKLKKPKSGSHKPLNADTKPEKRDASSYGYVSESSDLKSTKNTCENDEKKLKKDYTKSSAESTPKKKL